MSGWIKVFRSFNDWEWYGDSKMVHLFLHLIIKANHKDQKWQGITIRKGQLATSFNSLSLATGISVQSVRTILGKLQKTGEIKIQSTKHFTVVTVCKYSDYQQDDNFNQHTTNTQLTNDQQTANRQLTTNKNDKNDKNVKKRVKGVFTPPSEIEVVDYFIENGYIQTAALKAFNYYTVGDWNDSRGNPVKNWKQKMQSVWFKEENKTITGGKRPMVY